MPYSCYLFKCKNLYESSSVSSEILNDRIKSIAEKKKLRNPKSCKNRFIFGRNVEAVEESTAGILKISLKFTL